MSECLLFNATFNNSSVYIVAVSIIDGGNRRTRRKIPTCRKSLTNFITYCCAPRPGRDSNSHDCIGSCKSNYHTITITTAPALIVHKGKKKILYDDFLPSDLSRRPLFFSYSLYYDKMTFTFYSVYVWCTINEHTFIAKIYSLLLSLERCKIIYRLIHALFHIRTVIIPRDRYRPEGLYIYI